MNDSDRSTTVCLSSEDDLRGIIDKINEGISYQTEEAVSKNHGKKRMLIMLTANMVVTKGDKGGNIVSSIVPMIVDEEGQIFSNIRLSNSINERSKKISGMIEDLMSEIASD